MRRILFIHKNFPAQFGGLAHWLVSQGWDVTYATQRKIALKGGPRILRWPELPEMDPVPEPLAANLIDAVREARHFAQWAEKWRTQGYVPDIVVAHSGWGCGSFVKDIWRDCKYVPYFEWHYAWPPVDATPHLVKADIPDRRHLNRLRNAAMLIDVDAADAMITPTDFQRAQWPDHLAQAMTVMPDGIDTRVHAPGPRNAKFLGKHGIPLDAEIVTYVARGMEPARGFPELMRLVSDLQSVHPNLHAIIIGQDRVAYGDKNEKWKDRMLEEVKTDPARTHFTGLVSRNDLVAAYQASDLHLYLSASFVLSWSCTEALACGTLVLAADNAPSREVIEDGVTGFLADPYDREGLAKAALDLLDRKDDLGPVHAAARAQMVEKADALTVAFPAKLRLFERLL